MDDLKALHETMKESGKKTADELFAIVSELGYSQNVAAWKQHCAKYPPGKDRAKETLSDEVRIGQRIAGLVGSVVSTYRPRPIKMELSPPAPPAPPVKVGGKNEGKNQTELYIEWCAKNDHVANDIELAHFAGVTPPAYYHARARAVDAGYQFEKNGSGWKVIARPQPKKRTYTEEEVRAMMSELVAKFGKVE